jgi:hypothetical protein
MFKKLYKVTYRLKIEYKLKMALNLVLLIYFLDWNRYPLIK